MKEILKEILGQEAFNGERMQVPENIQKLVKTLNYLFNQIEYNKKFILRTSENPYPEEDYKCFCEMLTEVQEHSIKIMKGE